MKSFIIFFIPFFLVTVGLSQRPGWIYEPADVAFSWTNKASFEKGGDYFKNLDLEQLEDAELPQKYKQLIRQLWRLTLPYDKEALSGLADLVNQTEDEDLQRLYQLLLIELLHQEEAYPALTQNFPEAKGGKALLARVYAGFEKLHQISRSPAERPLHKIKRSIFGAIFMDIRANGAPVPAIFDTGADQSVVSETFAKKAGVNPIGEASIDIGTPNGKSLKGRFGMIEKLEVGKLIVENVPVFIFPDENMRLGTEEKKLNMDFILGWPLISRLKFTIDEPGGNYKVDIPRQSTKSNKETNFFWMGYPGVKLMAPNGQSLLFGIDTGLDITELKRPVFKKFQELPTFKDSVGVITAGGMEMMKLEVVKGFPFIFDENKITVPRCEIYDNKDFFFLHQDGTLGADIFTGNVVVFDYPNRRLSIERPETRVNIEKRVDSLLSQLAQNYPGLSCTITQGQRIVYSRGFGWRNQEPKKPFSDSTSFNLYSVSKTLTGMALARAVELEKIDMDASILQVDSSLPEHYRKITPKLLVSHMSGIRHYENDWMDFASKECPDTRTAVEHFIQDPLKHAPGSKALYSTFGYVLLSHVVEQAATSQSYSGFLDEELFDKAGMINTYLDGKKEADPYRSTAYYTDRQTGELEQLSGINNGCKFGGGGFVTTTRDLGKLSIALLNGNILSEEAFARFYRPIADPATGLLPEPQKVDAGYAMGIVYHKIKTKEGTVFYLDHAGASPGGESYLLLLPEKKVSIALGANYNGSGLEEAGKKIMGWMLKN